LLIVKNKEEKITEGKIYSLVGKFAEQAKNIKKKKLEMRGKA